MEHKRDFRHGELMMKCIANVFILFWINDHFCQYYSRRTEYRLFHTRIYRQVRWQRTWSAQQTSPKQVLDFLLGLKFNGNIKKCPGERRVWVFRYFANRNFCWKKGTFPSLGLVYFPYHFDLTSIVTSQNEYVKMWLASTLYSIFGTKQVTFWTLQTHRKIQ